MKYFILVLLLLFLVNCTESSKTKEVFEEVKTTKLASVQKIEESHQKEKFLSYDNVKFNIEIDFKGNERLKGSMTLATNSSKGLIELKDGNKLFFIKDRVYYSPGMNEEKVRFDAYTWSYFFMFPYKLSDEGTIWSKTEKKEMNGNWYNWQKLTFESGTGDAPDDWYQVYSDTSSNLLQVSAYIVTLNKSIEEAESSPHAIAYGNYQMLESIPVATEWNFYEWDKTNGLTDTIGNAFLSDFEFIENSDSLFVPPTNFLTI